MFFVRTAMPDDLPVVRQILQETWHDTYDGIYGQEQVSEIVDELYSLDNLRDIREREHSEFLVADNGEVVGGMAYATQNDKTIHLHSHYVHPRYQGGKTGLHLMIEIENSFIDVETIQLEIDSMNVRAVEFYEKYGFKQVSQKENFSPPAMPDSMIRMEKLLIFADD